MKLVIELRDFDCEFIGFAALCKGNVCSVDFEHALSFDSVDAANGFIKRYCFDKCPVVRASVLKL